MLFKILKLFALDVPAKIEAVKRRVEQATDHFKQVAQATAVIAALSAVAIVAGVGLIALYLWTANAYGMYAGLGVVGAILVVVTVALAAAAAVKARSLSSDETIPARTTAGTAVTVSDPDVENAAIAEAAAAELQTNAAAFAAAARPVAPIASVGDLVEPLAFLVPKVLKFPTVGNPATDELIGKLAATARGTADDAVNRAANVIRHGNRANLVVVLTGAVFVGWLLAHQARR